jgi:SAM-dependent methyltransferase
MIQSGIRPAVWQARQGVWIMGASGVAGGWSDGDAYNAFVGRWSRVVAGEFVAWLAVPAGGRWLDVGCGTGALSAAILELASPAELVGIDPSAGFVAHARERILDSRARFEVGDAGALPGPEAAFDAVVAGLVVNHVPDPVHATAEMSRVTRPGGVVGTYVWDYADGMEMLSRFWDAAVALDPAARGLDQRNSYRDTCNPDALMSLFTDAGLHTVEVRAIEVPAVFADVDAYWTPFLGGAGVAPSYVATLGASQRDALRVRLDAELPVAADGAVHLTARAWAVRGER